MCYKDIRGGIFIVISRYEKANNKYIKNYGKNKEPSYLNYWEVNNLDGSVMLLKLPVAGLRWDENTAQFSKDYTENYNEDSK